MLKIVKKSITRIFVSVLISALFFTGCASTSKGKKSITSETPVEWDSAIVRGKLENGMSYYVRKNGIPANRISLRLVVNAGSAMEDDDQKGVAHFVEHLAFNGTENFEKSAIVDYFEKIGMNFGADLNAYTSFEQTVYMLEIPADDPKMLETAMLILHDWACAITFPQEEVDKERGVVTEEWRLRQNLNGRVSDKECEILLKDSRFVDRLPIGDMDVIKNVSRDRVVDFYKKWYRPEIMSVIAVGDVDTSILEKAITTAMSKIPASKEKLTIPEFRVPVPSEKSLYIMKDSEQAYTNVFLFNPVENFKVRETEEDIRTLIAKEIASRIFNTRMNEITNSPEATWLYAGSSEVGLTNFSLDEYLVVCPKSGIFSASMQAFFDELDKFLIYGVTQTEMDRIKMSILSQEELNYQNKDKMENAVHAGVLTTYATTGKIPVSREDYLRIYNQAVPEITVEEVNQEIEKAFGGRGKMMLILASQTEELPAEDEINEIWKSYKNPEIKAYEDDVSDTDLMERPAKKGKVISKTTNTKLGLNEYVLENGIRILVKKTDFDANFMYMKASSKGGKYQIDEKDVPSVNVALSYMLYSGFKTLPYNQLMKKLQTKKLGLSFSVNDVDEVLSGNCKVDDSEALLQLVNLMFTQTQFTKESWETVMQSERATAEAHGAQPSDHFEDKINEILYGKDNIYTAPYDMNLYNKFDAEVAERIYRQRFANPADFTFCFIGDMDEEALIEDCCYYLGSMETSEEREETVYKYWDFPKGKPNAVVKKGLGDQGQVFIGFGGSLPAENDIEVSYKESFIISQLQALLDIRLREVIREDKSGSYGINVGSYIEGYPERYHRTFIGFGCEPGRVQELTDEVMVLIQKLQNEPIDSVYIEKLQETCRRSRETNLYDNNWWIHRIEAELVYTYEPDWVTIDINKLVDWITAENLQNAAKKYLNTQNFISVYLVPEKF